MMTIMVKSLLIMMSQTMMTVGESLIHNLMIFAMSPLDVLTEGEESILFELHSNIYADRFS